MTCEEFLAEFGDYLEKRISQEVLEEIEAHLSECGPCHVLYDSTRKTLMLTSKCNSFDLPASATESIIKSVMSKLRKEHGPSAKSEN